jgi:hypothetical protein
MTIIPFLVASGMSILSTPTPARAIALSLPELVRTSGVTFAAADYQPIVLTDNTCQLVFVDAGLYDGFDAVHGIEQVNSLLCEFVRDENFYHRSTPKKSYFAFVKRTF